MLLNCCCCMCYRRRIKNTTIPLKCRGPGLVKNEYWISGTSSPSLKKEYQRKLFFCEITRYVSLKRAIFRRRNRFFSLWWSQFSQIIGGLVCFCKTSNFTTTRTLPITRQTQKFPAHYSSTITSSIASNNGGPSSTTFNNNFSEVID